MAGQIDFGLLTTPNFLGDALRYQKAGMQQRDEERLRRARAAGDIATIRQIDPEEAAALEKAQLASADRAGRIKGATAAASGDWQGARTAYAGAGDIESVASVDALHDASVKKVSDEAKFLQGVLAKGGPEAVLQAFDQRAATYGGSPEQVAQIREKLVANPQQTLDALAGAPTYSYQRAADGSIIAVNPTTAEAKEIYKGTRPAPAGFRYAEDGALEVDPGYVAGVAQIAGVRRQAVVDRPIKKTGGKAASSPFPPGYAPK